MKVVAVQTFYFFHNRIQHAVHRNAIYSLDYIETDEDEKEGIVRHYVLKDFPGTFLPEEIFRPVDYKFGREVCSKIEKSFPF